MIVCDSTNKILHNILLRPRTSNRCYPTFVYQAEQRPGEYSQKISKFTKVLIHKIHGGRKKDSKFWNDQIDLTKKSDDEFSIPILENSVKTARLRKSLQISIYPFATLLIVLVVLIVARPDLFPFLDYHNIYSTISEHFINKTNTSAVSNKLSKTGRSFARPVITPRQYTKSVASISKKQDRPLMTISSVQSGKHEGTQTNMIKELQPISLSGNCSHGKIRMENTIFPIQIFRKIMRLCRCRQKSTIIKRLLRFQESTIRYIFP